MNKEDLLKLMEDNPIGEIKTFWDSNRAQLRDFFAGASDISNFWEVPCLLHTMLCGNNYLEQDLITCRRNGEVMDKIVNKRDNFGPSEFPNLVRQAAHLVNFMEVTGKHVKDLNLITEIGAGFGSMMKVCRILGFNKDYGIIDLPEFKWLQEIYTGEKILSFDFEMLENTDADNDLLISMWGLSEIPSGRPLYKDLNFSYYLFAYPPLWELDMGVGTTDNKQWFGGLTTYYNKKNWVELEIPKLEPNVYLIGAT